jgi:hypothetical protein
MTLAMIVEWGKLTEAAYVSAAFGIGVVLLAGLAVVASLQAQAAPRAPGMWTAFDR